MIAPASTHYSLDRQLPAAIRTGHHNLFTRYKDYPVFSWPWWWRRMLLFLPFAISIFLIPTYLDWLEVSDRPAAAMVALMTASAFMIMVGLGPGVASALRYRNFPEKWEGPILIVAIVVCMGLAYLANGWLRELCDQILFTFPEAKKKSMENAAKLKMSPIISIPIGFVFISLIGGFFAVPAYYGEIRRWRDFRSAEKESELRVQKQEASLRLSVLQAQVEPHFLFNTLASVRALLRHDPGQSEATLDALVAYLRASIPKLRDEGVSAVSTLGQQLDLCTSYLQVMTIRTAGRLQYAVEADPALRALAFPPMLLITLVENAIKHGIEPKLGPGRVTITATRDGDTLQVTVADDGMGLQPGVGGGLGLANVRAQLDALYAGRASFDLRSQAAHGVRAELRIPLDEQA
jgi:two-component sensor histidine kinase